MPGLLKYTNESSLNAPADWWLDMLQPTGFGKAYVDATDPVHAVRTWNVVVIKAYNTRHYNGGPDRRGRAMLISARKRAIENATWTDESGRAMTVRLTLKYKSYDEAYGFLHMSEFTYTVTRVLQGERA